MLSQISQKKIKSKLNKIYKSSISVKDLNFHYKEIELLINNFNKKNNKKKNVVSEKTSVVICYGDSIFDKKLYTVYCMKSVLRCL